MIKKKICILGAYAVGKTSLVEQYVRSIFSDKYHATIGVKTDQKDVEVDGQEVRLILWDVNGEDDHQKVKSSYIKGSAGFVLVADGCRKETLSITQSLQKFVFETLGEIPFFLFINKSDIEDEWEVDHDDILALEQQNWTVLKSSAKNGDNVEDGFQILVKEILNSKK